VTLRLPLIAGNWKLHHGPSDTARFFADFLRALPEEPTGTIAFFPPAVSIGAARAALADRPEILLGVQNLYWEPSGAFTGEVSAPLARDAGASLALVGHSERRHLFGERDSESVRKAVAAIAGGLVPVFCVGETLPEREAGEATAVVERQLEGLREAVASDIHRVVIAYEPVWAIGTGRTASASDASEMHAFVRHLLIDWFGEGGAEVPILYGGSVKPENAAELLGAPDVSGLLVGGASLDPEGFARICTLRA
jgi:triosephosphate isomerase (TIM)